MTTSHKYEAHKSDKRKLMIIFISIFLILLINYYSFYWWERLDTVMSYNLIKTKHFNLKKCITCFLTLGVGVKGVDIIHIPRRPLLEEGK